MMAEWKKGVEGQCIRYGGSCRTKESITKAWEEYESQLRQVDMVLKG